MRFSAGNAKHENLSYVKKKLCKEYNYIYHDNFCFNKVIYLKSLLPRCFNSLIRITHRVIIQLKINIKYIMPTRHLSNRNYTFRIFVIL